MHVDAHELKPGRLLVVMPTWLGDCVMAMPTLRALRELYPDAHITALVGKNVKPIIDPNPWVNRILTARVRRGGKTEQKEGGPFRLAAKLANGKFDLAVILPNSFRRRSDHSFGENPAAAWIRPGTAGGCC